MRLCLESLDCYTIAWIAALPIERAAATALLDDRHDAPQDFEQHHSDTNSYSWGRMGIHNIVIASLPAGSYGTTSAATTASNILSSLPQIKIGLLVGIGGGIARPPHQDIRLGDVVVSQPDRTTGGVIQYDLGKAKLGQVWERKGSLNTPPSVLLHAVSNLQAEHLIAASKIPKLLQAMWDTNPVMKRVRPNSAGFVPQGFENDRLFQSSYSHAGGDSCDKCDKSWEVERTPREDTCPEIHYGIIASGNALIKDATARDQLVEEIGGCLCVEMEAAGLMNHFPCIVIRGVSDYADSHKNDRWQQYASATAAAYAKELLGFVESKQLQATHGAIEMLRSIGQDVFKVKQEIKNVNSAVLNANQKSLLDKLHVADGASFNSYAEASYPACLENTRVELLDQILTWVHDPSAKALFWLNGMAGTGKSTISRTIARSLSQTNRLGASFFFKRGEADRGNATKFITTIARQLADKEPGLVPMLIKTIETDSTISSSAIQEQFRKFIFEPLSKITSSGQFIIIVDALDECEGDENIRTIIHLFARIQTQHIPWLKVFITSRPDLPVRLGFAKAHGTYQDFILHEIKPETIEHDISIFLEHEFRSIRDDYNFMGMETQLPPDWPGELRTKALVDLAKPLFISAATACRFISEPSHGHPNKLLDEILAYKGKSATSGLDATYLPILNRQIVSIQSERKRDEVIQLLRKLIGTIMTLESPLSSSALEQLLNIPQVIIVDQLKMLHSVLQVPMSSKDPIRPFHLSFRDFLVDPETRNKTPLWIDEKQMHQYIAVNCLRVMKEKLRRDIGDLRTPGIARSDIDEQIVTNHIEPELEYACIYWVDHLKKGDIHISDNELYLFLSSHLLHWVEALSIVGRASDSLGILRTLRSTLQPQETKEVTILLNDAIRFSLTYLSTIDSYPLQIYALTAFLPLKSPMRKTFLQSQWACLSISETSEQNWDSCLQTLEGHSAWVNRVVFSPDGQYLASASTDKTIRLWDAATGQCLQTLEGHSNGVETVVFSPDGQYLASASSGKTVRLWDAATGQCLQTLEGHSAWVYRVVFSPDGQYLASASTDKTVRLWDAATGQCLHTLKGHSKRVHTVVFSPDGQYLASASDDETIRLWNAATGQCLQTLEGHSGGVETAVFLLNAEYLASTSDDKPIQLWDTATGQCLQTLEGHSDRVEMVVFSPDGQYIASASRDKTARLWDTATGECLQTLEGHSDRVETVVFSPDETQLASASYDKTIRLWDVATGQCLQILKGHIDELTTVVFSPDGQYLASASYDKTVRLWDIATGQYLQTPKGHSDWVNTVAFSPDEKQLASASYDKTVRLWDAATGQCLQTLEGHSDGVETAVFSPDGQYLASASRDKTARLWVAMTGQCLQTLKGHSNWVNTVAFSPNAKYLASASDDKTVRLWDAATGQCLQTLKGHIAWVNRVVFSPNAEYLASASDDETVRLWDVATGQCIQVFDIGVIYWLSFTPDGSNLFTDAGLLIIGSNHWSCRPPKLLLDVSNPILLGSGLDEDRCWVTWHGDKALWLPANFRPASRDSLAISGSRVVIGSPTGRVTLICIYSDKLL